MLRYNFKKRHSLETRKKECSTIKEKYSDRIPVIIEKYYRSKLLDIDKNKYLVPKDLTIGQFTYIIRKRIKLNSYEALYVLFNNTLLNTNALISSVYDEYKDEDGFLYIIYTSENTFG